jgi:hypothetical protein
MQAATTAVGVHIAVAACMMGVVTITMEDLPMIATEVSTTTTTLLQAVMEATATAAAAAVVMTALAILAWVEATAAADTMVAEALVATSLQIVWRHLTATTAATAKNVSVVSPACS